MYDSLDEMSNRREALVEWAVPDCQTAINIQFIKETSVGRVTFMKR